MAKRLFDFSLALILLTFTLPLFPIIWVLVRIESPGPGFFKQIRVGRGGKHFVILKFRTMRADDESKVPRQVTTDGDSRITRLGRVLRKFKLDELPQLLNVLKGDMSIVGPRPEVPRYVSKYPEQYKRVLLYKPGLTDPASINFRNESAMIAGRDNPEEFYVNEILPTKLKMSLAYAEKANLLQDLMVCMKTFLILFRQS